MNRMATHFTCDDVIELVTGDAWGESEGESDDELDFESDPLDREQEAPNMSPDALEESMDATPDGSIDEDEIMSNSTMPSTTTATPLDPCHPVGPYHF